MGPNSGIQRYIPSTRMFYIQDYSRRIQGENYYWSLPKPFLGNKVRGGLKLGLNHGIPNLKLRST